MTVLVTGATGFVGSAITRQLVQRGVDVRVLVRSASNLRNLDGLPVTTVIGDLRDTGSLDRALSGCEGLFHVAADYRLWVPDSDAMYEANVEGTRAILLAATRANVRRVVYTSSVATLGVLPNGTPADEETPATLDDMVGPYKRSSFWLRTSRVNWRGTFIATVSAHPALRAKFPDVVHGALPVSKMLGNAPAPPYP